MSRRQEFLTVFLGALGARVVKFTKTTPNAIEGVAVYDATDPEECQEFRWGVSESDVPSDNVIRLIALLKDGSLLDIDRITISPEALREHFNTALGHDMSEEQFRSVLGELKSVQVPMIDDDQETDYFFIHE